MSNVRIYLPLVNNDMYDYIDYGSSCKTIVHELFSDDFGPPPLNLTIEVTTEIGKIVKVSIPYDDNNPAKVSVDDVRLE